MNPPEIDFFNACWYRLPTPTDSNFDYVCRSHSVAIYPYLSFLAQECAQRPYLPPDPSGFLLLAGIGGVSATRPIWRSFTRGSRAGVGGGF